MKIIYQLNKGVLILTLVLHLTIILGLYAQMALGAVQLLTALFLLFRWNLFAQQTKKQLKIYWTLVLLYGSCWFFKWNFLNDEILIIGGIILIPISIAGYFLYILNSIKNIEL